MKIEMAQVIELYRFECSIDDATAFGIELDCWFECSFSVYEDELGLFVDIEDCEFTVCDGLTLKVDGPWHNELKENVTDTVTSAIYEELEEKRLAL